MPVQVCLDTGFVFTESTDRLCGAESNHTLPNGFILKYLTRYDSLNFVKFPVQILILPIYQGGG